MSTVGRPEGREPSQARAWAPLRIATTFMLVIGGVALLTNLTLAITSVGPRKVLILDLAADIGLTVVAAALLYNLLQRDAIAEKQSVAAQIRCQQELSERAHVAALEAERSRFLQIMDAMPEGVCVISEDYEMEYVNPILEQIFGAPNGRKCHQYLYGLPEPCDGCPNADVFAGEVVRREWFSQMSGRSYEIVDTAMPERTAKRSKLELLHDVTEEVQARERTEELISEVARQAQEARAARAEVEQHAADLAALLDFSLALASTLSTQSLLELILDRVRQVIDYSSAIILMVEGDALIVTAYRGRECQECVIGDRIPIRDAVGFQAVRKERKPIIVPDLLADTPLARGIRAMDVPSLKETLRNSHSWMGVPLTIQGRVVGLLRFDHIRPGYYQSRHAQLALTIANQAAIALENAHLYEDAQKVATLEERQRMARELHDSVSQSLYGIALGTHAAREQLNQAPEKLQPTLDYILTLSENAVTEMRALVFELHPESLEQLGLVILLTKLVEAQSARYGVVTQLGLCAEPDLTLEAKEVTYRIAQEALRNISKHAQATTIKVRMECEEAWVSLEVVDDGVGFDTSSQFPGHFGLQSMRERAEGLGGRFEIESLPGSGTRVSVRLPRPSQAPTDTAPAVPATASGP